MKARARISPAFFGLTVIAVLVGGCGPSFPDTYPVTGTVTYQGEPVEGATVGFSPSDGNPAATGMTDSQGKYTLTTYQSGDGAVPGEFKVRVFKYDRAQEEVKLATVANESGQVPDDYKPEAETAAAAAPKHLLPDEFAYAHSTPLSYVVEAKENTFDISLE